MASPTTMDTTALLASLGPCRNNCSNAGTCVNGTCACLPGFDGTELVATANDCHISQMTVYVGCGIGVVCAIGPLLVVLMYWVKILCKTRTANKFQKLLYGHILVYSAACIAKELLFMLDRKSWADSPQPRIFINELKTAGIMPGTWVVCGLWFALVPKMFMSERIKSWAKTIDAHVYTIDAVAVAVYLALGLSCWKSADGLTNIGIDPYWVFNIDMILIALFSLPPWIAVVPCVFGVWTLIVPPKFLEGKHADTLSKIKLTMLLYSNKVYAELGSHDPGGSTRNGLQEVVTKLRMSLFIIFFCAGGCVSLCILMIPTSGGIENIFRYHSEIWISAVMDTLGHIWHFGMLFLFQPKEPNTVTKRSINSNGVIYLGRLGP